ncbi:putative PEP-binding protein [Listeria monocytogenes]
MNDSSKCRYPADFKKALLFGAEGIGLCRTEHMFLMKNEFLMYAK